MSAQQNQNLKKDGYITTLTRLIITPIFLIFFLMLGGCKPPPPPLGDDLSLKIFSITQDGIQTVQQGSRLLILIPTDVYFEPLEGNMKGCHIASIVKMSEYVARYAAAYPNSAIYVRGYAAPLFPPYNAFILSQQYADAISAYLWNAGIEQRRIQAVGYGDNYPIGDSETVPGRGYNRRVEIQIN